MLERILIDINNSKGIEIGALCSPIVEKNDGNIFYVDYADKAFLQNRYKNYTSMP